jgi:hypothetical protein
MDYLTRLLMESSIFWDIMQCSPLKVNRRFGKVFRLQLQVRRISSALLSTCFLLVSCLAYSSTLKMEATCSSEKWVGFQRTTRLYIPEGRTLSNHRCENLKSYKPFNSYHYIAASGRMVKAKLSLLQAIEDLKVAIGRGSHIS